MLRKIRIVIVLINLSDSDGSKRQRRRGSSGARVHNFHCSDYRRVRAGNTCFRKKLRNKYRNASYEYKLENTMHSSFFAIVYLISKELIAFNFTILSDGPRHSLLDVAQPRLPLGINRHLLRALAYPL